MMAEEDDLRREVARLRRRDRERRHGSSMVLIELDLQGKILRWNRRAEQVFGWSKEEARGQPITLVVPPGSRARAEDGMRRVFAGETVSGRWTCVRKDGSAGVCEWHPIVLRDEHGAPERLLCEVRDVTVEEEVQRQQRLMQALADHSPMGIFAKGPDGRHLYANAAFAGSLGRTPAEVIGRGDDALFDPAIAADLRRHDAEIAAVGRAMTREDAGVGPHADRTYWTLKFPLHDERGEVVAICGILHDISDRTRAELARAELHAQVVAAQEALLVELSSPLIPLADGVLAMPLIGSIDAARAERILAALLAGTAEQRARAVILDVTGVRDIDAGVAAVLLRAARAVRLLGAEAILTGIRPDVARTLVHLDVDLAGVVTLASLRAGIEHASRRR